MKGLSEDNPFCFKETGNSRISDNAQKDITDTGVRKSFLGKALEG